MVDRIRGVLITRFAVLCVLRFASLAMIVTGVYAVLHQVFLGSVPEIGMTGFTVIYESRSLTGIAFGLLVPGIALALLSKRLSRWIVPAIRLECPQCSYNLHLIKGETCPECGYVIAERKPTQDS